MVPQYASCEEKYSIFEFLDTIDDAAFVGDVTLLFVVHQFFLCTDIWRRN